MSTKLEPKGLIINLVPVLLRINLEILVVKDN
jgi:hypothetical protein